MLGYETYPEARGGLRIVENLPRPVPGTHDVVVEVRAFSINRGELALITSRSNGWRPGQDVSGVISAVGPDVTEFEVGDRVVAVADGGGWSEQVAVPEMYVASLPDEVSFSDAAALPIAGLTALRALRNGGSLLGRRVLVTGATGAVGGFAIQLARAAGATVTAQVSAPERERQVRELGAHHVVTNLNGSGPFELACDGVGGEVLTAIASELVPEGVAVSYGTSGGQAKLGLLDFAKSPNAKVIFLFHSRPEEQKGNDLAILAEKVAHGSIRPLIGRRSDWNELPDALSALKERRVRGKAVLTL